MIGPLIPKKTSKRGRPRNDNRRTSNGILYALKTGCAWEDLPKEYGSDSSCWRRLNEWSLEGMWERIWRTFLSQLEWAQAFLDRSFVPAKKGGDGVGKTRVGKGAKVMTVVEGHGLPIGLYVDSAPPPRTKSHGLSQLCRRSLSRASAVVPRRDRKNWWRTTLMMYDGADFRHKLRRRGLRPTIPTFERRERKKPKCGRPLRTGAGYRQRWKVERCFGWMD